MAAEHRNSPRNAPRNCKGRVERDRKEEKGFSEGKTKIQHGTIITLSTTINIMHRRQTKDQREKQNNGNKNLKEHKIRIKKGTNAKYCSVLFTNALSILLWLQDRAMGSHVFHLPTKNVTGPELKHTNLLWLKHHGAGLHKETASALTLTL